MKKKVFRFAALLLMSMASTMVAKGNHTDDNVMTKQSNGTYVVNSTDRWRNRSYLLQQGGQGKRKAWCKILREEQVNINRRNIKRRTL